MKTDFLIIGSGIAGLNLALKLAKIGKVLIFTKKDISAGSTGLAQGGIAGVRKIKDDTFAEHFEDTMRAGDYLNNKGAVHFLVENAPRVLSEMEEYGLRFDFDLHQEGGHSFRRISHVADETGRAIQEVLKEQVKNNQNIQIIENVFVVDLLKKDNKVVGVSYFDGEKSLNCYAQKTILSTGGAGQIYTKTTNPSVATGDGMAMAIRAGARLKNMEFVQFHPTAFDFPRDPLFLLSEAMRGDGAELVNEKGERFTEELDSRDKVSRDIFRQKEAFLDFTAEKRDILAQKFPNIFENLLTAGYDLSEDLIPITPAAHFFCGGVETDINGKTSLKNLYALGETAYTGVHGANRLASNSLTEALVFADSIYGDIKKDPIETEDCNLPVYEFVSESEKDVKIRQKIQEEMWGYAGIVRTEKGLKKLIKNLENMRPEGTEVNNILAVALSVANSALVRKESIGCHFRKD